VVNKADRTGAEKLRQEIEITLGIRRGNAFRNMPAHHGVGGGAAGRRGRRAAAQHDGQRDVPKPNVPNDTWNQPVLAAAAVKGEGVAEVAAALDRHHEWLAASGELEQRRKRRLLERTREVVDRATRRWVWEETRAERLIAERLDEVAGGRLSPYELAAEVLEELKQGERI
jgi:LAO/AO transport system kinase